MGAAVPASSGWSDDYGEGVVTPKASIVLLTKNGEASLPALLDVLWLQKTTMAVEIVAVDSGSTDRTVQILEGRVTKIVRIPPKTFNHGLTRNLAIQQTTGDIVVFLVQDALPVSEHWLDNLTAPLIADTHVAGAFARQQPHPEASPLIRHYLSHWIGASEKGWTSTISGDAEWQAMSPVARFLRCVFDNVCSAIRRSVWEVHPFAETPIAEDIGWAREVLLAGYRITYTPEATVIHSHDRPARYEYRRTYLLHRRLWELFELQMIPTLPRAGRAVASSLALHLWFERARPSLWPHAAALALAWPVGQYLGARAGVHEKRLPKWRPGTV